MHCQATISAYHLWEWSHGKFVLDYIISVISTLLKISTITFVIEKNNQQNKKMRTPPPLLKMARGVATTPVSARKQPLCRGTSGPVRNCLLPIMSSPTFPGRVGGGNASTRAGLAPQWPAQHLSWMEGLGWNSGYWRKAHSILDTTTVFRNLWSLRGSQITI